MLSPVHDLLATTAFGLESVVARELQHLGMDAKGAGTGRVEFRADAGGIARANLWLRSADRVLLRVAKFPAPDFDALFEGVKALAWEQWVPRDGAFPVAGRSVKSQLSSVPAVQRSVKRAIVDRLMHAHRTQTLPETGAPVRIEVAILHDEATLTIDTTGDGLHKRGYRPVVGTAALRETLAAGLVQLSGWRAHQPLVDPFCGNGTIAIEAAMLALRMAPGIGRGFDAEQWGSEAARGEDFGGAFRHAKEEARTIAQDAPKDALRHAIHASDIDEGALAIARRAAVAAGALAGIPLERHIHFKKMPFDQLRSTQEYGCIVTNPPYGVRLGEQAELDELYRSLALVLRGLPTWSFHILTGRLDLERWVGQHATRRRKLYNSQIECTFFSFLGPKPPRLGEEKGRQSERDEHVAQDVAPGEAQGQSQGETPGDATPAALPEATHHAPTGEHDGESSDTPRPAQGAARSPSPSRAHANAPAAYAPSQSPPRAFGGLRERDEREIAQFEDRLAKNIRHLRKYPSRGISCYRVYERDCPDVPIIIDRYEDWVHVSEYEREHSRTFAQQADWWDAVRGAISRACEVPPSHVIVKEKFRQRGLSQHEKQGDTGETLIAHEGGLKFEVNLRDYTDTGLFLDHRLTREMVRSLAPGKRLLNLFCYTGSFTVYAANAGAASTTSVDLSNTYLAWCERNLRLNGLWGPQHALVRSDVLAYLEALPQREQFDLVVIDPPTFSNSASTEEDWQVHEDQSRVLAGVARVLSPRGVIFFSTNYRRFKLDEDAIGTLGLRARDISRQTVPPEYRNTRIHRCWRIERA